jgi:hypothetical protein
LKTILMLHSLNAENAPLVASLRINQMAIVRYMLCIDQELKFNRDKHT